MNTGPQGQKHPSDVIGNAVHCCRVLVGDHDEEFVGNQRNGGLKGGKARAAKLSSARRSEIAKKAAAARWAK